MPSAPLPAARRGLKRARVYDSNRLKVLMCYLVCFALPLMWLYGALAWVYPYRLVGSAPSIAQNLLTAFPFLDGWLSDAARASAAPAVSAPRAWREALMWRERQWMLFLAATLAAAWLVTLLCQLAWRFAHASPYQLARGTAVAIRHYRLTQTAIWLVNLAAAALVWLLGVRFIQGRTQWDYLTYFVPYALNALASALCFRLAAPSSLSGRRAFFKRL